MGLADEKRFQGTEAVVRPAAPMGRFDHGGDTYGHPGVVDFSANVNPLGMPQAAREVLAGSVDAYAAYPDPACRDLTRALAARAGVDPGWVLCTAGATDLMSRVCQALRPRRALVLAPCYGGYEQALVQAGAGVRRHTLTHEEGFALTPRVLGDLDEGVDLAFLASPNNPTGLTIARPLLRDILERARDLGVWLVLDECFLGFTDLPSATSLCAAYPNLLVMRAFTKTYAMAGLRLGYGICADAALMGGLRAAGQPWAVSTPAQLAGLAALGEQGFLERTRAFVGRERARLAQGLATLGMEVLPGEANYLMFQSPVPLYDALLARGVMVRRCQNYQGLSDGLWYRVAVRTHGENDLLLARLEEVVA